MLNFWRNSPYCQLKQNWEETIRQLLEDVTLKWLFVKKLLIISVWRRVKSIIWVHYQVDFIESMMYRFLHEILWTDFVTSWKDFSPTHGQYQMCQTNKLCNTLKETKNYSWQMWIPSAQKDNKRFQKAQLCIYRICCSLSFQSENGQWQNEHKFRQASGRIYSFSAYLPLLQVSHFSRIEGEYFKLCPQASKFLTPWLTQLQ